MEGQAALAFVARREGSRSMEASRWRHVMSLELGWMPPADAGRYVEACVTAGLLEVEGDALALTFDPKSVAVPRGFRPNPARLPEGPDAAPEPANHQDTADAPEGLFATWLPKVAAARGEDLGDTMTAMEKMQEEAGGLLHAEAAILALGAAAGLDVTDPAGEALRALQA